jgi:hypothetical protein
MEPPLQIVKGGDGILRDIHDRPIIVVFNATKSDLGATKGGGVSPVANASEECSPSHSCMRMD